MQELSAEIEFFRRKHGRALGRHEIFATREARLSSDASKASVQMHAERLEGRPIASVHESTKKRRNESMEKGRNQSTKTSRNESTKKLK